MSPLLANLFYETENGRTVLHAMPLLLAALCVIAIAYPDPAKVRQPIKRINYLDLQTLIQLKLAARRHQDFADVVNLISVHNLDESYLDRLHPTVRKDFIECLEEKRREDEYEASEE